MTARELFANVRRNYFRLYFHYMYFNVARIVYLQIDNIFAYIILGPTIVAGAITLGMMNQILNALGQVRTSFQYLVNSWTTIVELLSIYKRLRAFEATIPAAAARDRQRVPRHRRPGATAGAPMDPRRMNRPFDGRRPGMRWHAAGKTAIDAYEGRGCGGGRPLDAEAQRDRCRHRRRSSSPIPAGSTPRSS